MEAPAIYAGSPGDSGTAPARTEAIVAIAIAIAISSRVQAICVGREASDEARIAAIVWLPESGAPPTEWLLRA